MSTSKQQYKFENTGRNPITVELPPPADSSSTQRRLLQWGLPGDLTADKKPAHIVVLTAEEYEVAKKSKAFAALIDPNQPAFCVLRQMVI
jgi:hypothetical protein